MAWKLWDFKTMGAAFLLVIFGVQVISLLISAIFPSVPILKGGPMILILLVSIVAITLLVAGLNLEALKNKETIFFMIIILALVGLAFVFGKEYFPQIFSISPEGSESLRQAFSIFGGP